jgi:hypothetical protein
MELLFLYILNDKRNIKGCSYNFSSEYTFSFDEPTSTFSMVHHNGLPRHWFGTNILNVTAVVGKNGAGKTNLMDCIIKALCGQGGGWIIYKYQGTLYTNVPSQVEHIKFSFPITRFKRFGSPLNSEFKEHIDDTVVTFYSTAIDRSLSNRHSHYSKFNDISNAFLLRQPLSRLIPLPEYATLPEVDIMQNNDMFKLLLFFIYSHENNKTRSVMGSLPEYFRLTLHIYTDEVPTHPTYKALTNNIENEGFKEKIKQFILRQLFLRMNPIPKNWDENTSYNDIVSYLTNGETYRPNLYDVLCQLYDDKNIIYLDSPSGLRRGHHELSFKIRIGAVTQEFLNALYSYYNFIPMGPYASYQTMESNVSNAQVSIDYGISSGERALYTLISRLMGVIFSKQGEIHHAALNKIVHSDKFNGKTIIILLDEPDLQLHPEWQQQFISTVLNMLRLYFSKVQFQIIFTTHSPILLSDIPKSNVIFVEKKADGFCSVCTNADFQETFGANIHSLYNNSFFLNGVPIGKFAKQKIQSLADRINQGIIDQRTLDDIYRIGEPIIRNTLLQMYDTKSKERSKESRISLLKAELAKLENT